MPTIIQRKAANEMDMNADPITNAAVWWTPEGNQPRLSGLRQVAALVSPLHPLVYCGPANVATRTALLQSTVETLIGSQVNNKIKLKYGYIL